MSNRRPSIRTIMVGVACATAAAFFGISSGSPAIAAPSDGSIRGAGLPGAVKDSYIVVLKDKTASSAKVRTAASTLTGRYGGTVRRVYSHSVRGFSTKMTEATAKRLAASGDVAYVEQNRTVSKSDTQTNPPWGLDRIDQATLPFDNSYTYPTTASNVHAYVIDSGIRISHQQFGGRASYGFDFVDNPPDPVADDCNGHGTHVAGTIGGTDFGVAKAVQLVAVRVLDCAGKGTEEQVIAGIDWVTANAVKPAVANMSLGSDAVITAVDDAVKASIASGITYAVAAGNESVNACDRSPAGVPEAITVGATDETDFRATFSNIGPCVDIFGPGVNILSSFIGSDTDTAVGSGTSMAAPHASGIAALLLSATPALTPQQVRDAIVNGGTTQAVKNPGIGSPRTLLHVGTTPSTVPISLLARANGKYVTAENAGSSPLIANRNVIGGWEKFSVVDAGNGFIALFAHANGKYVTAENGGASALIANRTAIGAWEKFQIVNNPNGSISLKANANGKYVTAENGGASALIANRTAIGLWESFDQTGPPVTVSLVANANFLVVTAENAGKSPLIANREFIGLWEEFDLVDVGNGFIALFAHANNRYVVAENAGKSSLIANRTSVGAWEKFRLTNEPGGGISLQANANLKYVTAENGGASPLIANRAAVGAWELFYIISIF